MTKPDEGHILTDQELAKLEKRIGEYTVKLLTINGDIDQYEDMMKRKAADEAGRYKQMETELEDLNDQQTNEHTEVP